MNFERYIIKPFARDTNKFDSIRNRKMGSKMNSKIQGKKKIRKKGSGIMLDVPGESDFVKRGSVMSSKTILNSKSPRQNLTHNQFRINTLGTPAFKDFSSRSIPNLNNPLDVFEPQSLPHSEIYSSYTMD